MNGLHNLPRLLCQIRAVTADMAMLLPELVALARHLETAAQQGQVGACLTLGDAVERIVDRLRDH